MHAGCDQNRTQSVEEETAAHYCYYGALDGLMLNNNNRTTTMDAARPASSVEERKVEEMMTTALLLDGALGDMVAVSTPRTGLDTADGEEGVWQTVRRAESHPQDDLNLWWLVIFLMMSRRRQ